MESEWIGRLLDWYAANARDLPWRRTTEAYPVWISEVMLQQTRVEAVRGYWTRFLAALPTVRDLSEAEDDRLMKLWEGLGYYSRARNLKRAARQVVERFDGAFPADYAALLSLPGVGEYTAGAVASICFGIPVPAVDGNVLRVMARLADDDADVLDPAVRRAVRAAGVQEIAARELALTRYLYQLLAVQPHVELYAGKPDERFAGILAFNVKGRHSNEVADSLDQAGVCVRGGLHCAPLAHKKLGTLERGAVRVSVGMFNTRRQMEKLAYLIKKII